MEGPVIRRELFTAIIDRSKFVAKIEAQEVVMNVGATAPFHLHPCPTIGVVEEGEIDFEIEGKPVQHLKRGDAFYEPADTRVVKFNNVGAVSAKFVVFYLLSEGEKDTIRLFNK